MHQVSPLSESAEKLRTLKQRAAGLLPPQSEWAVHIHRDPLKRLFDIVFSASFLLTFSPVFLLISLLIRATSPGPIFYKSKRLGRGGQIIECWKFRTMYRDAEFRLYQLLRCDVTFKKEWDVFQKVKLDPRITPIGRFLRKTSLDEIPQFWNVLKGDLSVVGPRPPTLIGSPEHYWREISLLYGANTEIILSVRPGITGLWQISGRSQISFAERSQLERSYVESRTFWQDLVLIAKTVPAVLLSKGAF
jgi:undecaprenyl-phosphate galactose phosphotransferase